MQKNKKSSKHVDSTKTNNSTKNNGKQNVKLELKVDLVGDIHYLVTMLD